MLFSRLAVSLPDFNLFKGITMVNFKNLISLGLFFSMISNPSLVNAYWSDGEDNQAPQSVSFNPRFEDLFGFDVSDIDIVSPDRGLPATWTVLTGTASDYEEKVPVTHSANPAQGENEFDNTGVPFSFLEDECDFAPQEDDLFTVLERDSTYSSIQNYKDLFDSESSEESETSSGYESTESDENPPLTSYKRKLDAVDPLMGEHFIKSYATHFPTKMGWDLRHAIMNDLNINSADYTKLRRQESAKVSDFGSARKKRRK